MGVLALEPGAAISCAWLPGVSANTDAATLKARDNNATILRDIDTPLLLPDRIPIRLLPNF
jgi:hypothetical protein